MKIENISQGKIIGFGDVTILPGMSADIPAEFETSPVIKVYENAGLCNVSGTPKKTAKPKTTKKDTAAEKLRKSRLESLEGISDEDLGKLAKDLGINPADCKDTADVKEKVKAALSK